MAAALFHFAEGAGPARALAGALAVPAEEVEVHVFPDRESRVRVPAGADIAILFRSLDDPNARLVELLLAASALRDMGAGRVVLVAPYLAYMRQDMAFRPGEAVSQRVIGRLLADHFDGLVTVDPHLHRVASMAEVSPGIPALSVSAAPVLAGALAGGLDPRTLLVGPDGESRPWVESIARPLGLEALVGKKVRSGDRSVRISLPGAGRVAGRPAVIVDDVVSSGMTMVECAKLLHGAGAASVEAIATHGLASPADIGRMQAGGIAQVRTTDSISGSGGSIPLAPVLAEAIRAQGWA